MWQWTGSIRSCIFSVWTPIRLSPCRSKHTRCIRAVHPRIAKQASHGAGLCQSWSRMKVLHDGKERKVVHPKIDVNILVSLLESLSIHVFQSMFIMRSGLRYIYIYLPSRVSVSDIAVSAVPPDSSFSDPEPVVQSDCDPPTYVPWAFFHVWENSGTWLCLWETNYAQLRVLNLVRLLRVLIKNLFKGWLFGALTL